MPDHPHLDAIERDALAEMAIMLGQEADLQRVWPDGDPWSRTCRHHGAAVRMRRVLSRMSAGVVAVWCSECDRGWSGWTVPEGWR